MLKNLCRISLAFILVFAFVSCTDKSGSDLADQAQEVLGANTPLGQFLSESSKGAVIKFHAEWCSTCKRYAPTFEKVSHDMAEAVDFYEVDVDDSQYKDLLKQLKISRIPETVFINKERTSISKKLGAIPRVKLEKLISSQLI